MFWDHPTRESDGMILVMERDYDYGRRLRVTGYRSMSYGISIEQKQLMPLCANLSLNLCVSTYICPMPV